MADAAARIHHAPPGDVARPRKVVQGVADCPGRGGRAELECNLPVRDHRAPGDAAHELVYAVIERFAVEGRIGTGRCRFRHAESIRVNSTGRAAPPVPWFGPRGGAPMSTAIEEFERQ